MKLPSILPSIGPGDEEEDRRGEDEDRKIEDREKRNPEQREGYCSTIKTRVALGS